MSDTQTADFWNISGYDLMETRLKCLELSIKALSVAGCEVNDAKILGLAQKFTEFVLENMDVAEKYLTKK